MSSRFVRSFLFVGGASALLSACGHSAVARRLPGSDIALPQRTGLIRSLLTMVCDTDGLALVRPDSSSVGCAIARRDTAQRERGGVGRAPRITP
jgi:hypothetical protein